MRWMFNAIMFVLYKKQILTKEEYDKLSDCRYLPDYFNTQNDLIEAIDKVLG